MICPASSTTPTRRKNRMSLRTSVATLVWQSVTPAFPWGWCSAQRIKIEMIASGNHTIICTAPVRTLGLRGSELSRSDNPSVMALRETAMPAPFTQGSRRCSRTSAFFDGSRNALRIVTGGNPRWKFPHKYKKACRPETDGKPFLQFSKASYFHRPSGYLPSSVMAFRALTTMGLSAA